MLNIRFDFSTNVNDNDSINSKKPIRFGLRESIKNLKSANTRLVAISPDIKPRYVVNRIILRAVANNKGIDVICLPSMDILIQKLLGFSCFALVITENQSHEFDELLNWCHKILIVYRETPSLNQSVFSKQCFRKRNGPDNSYQNRHRVSNEDNGLNLNQFYLPSEDVILGQRAFHPVNSAHSKPLDLILKPLNQIRSGFIQLDTFDATGTVTIVPNLKINQKQHKKANKNKYMEKSIDLYQPLTIHKIQQNPRKTECSGKQMEGRKKRLSKHFQGADTTD